MRIRCTTTDAASAAEGRYEVAERAFTLLEVVCSAALLLVTVVALFSGFSSGFGIIRTTREDLRATQILTQKMEALRLLTWSQLSLCPSSFQDCYYPQNVTNNTAGTVYYGTISIGAATNISDLVTYKSRVRLVTIGVVWTNFLGGHPIVHARQMQTLSAQYGIQNYIWGKP
ncbi:MAG: hypothetical protein KGJ60_12355 [Verrucomicrobiota bacterium]|nr:hypothetical protein [Verrucomicrobiota bacterium]